MRRCPHGGDWSELAESLMEKQETQHFSLHFWRLSGSMNHVEECMGQDPRILRGRILGRLRIKGMRRLDVLSSWNPEAGWTLVLEPGGCRLLLIVCDIALSLRRRVSHSTSLRLVSIHINSPTKGPWPFVSGPEAVYNPEVFYEPEGHFWTRWSCGNPEYLLKILRSYLDQEVMWEPGGSPFDRIWTRRSCGNTEDPEVVLNPEVARDPEVVSNPEVALDLEVILNPEVVWEPRDSSRPEGRFEPGGFFWTRRFHKNLEVYLFQALRSFHDPETAWGPEGTVLRLPRQDYSRYLFGFRILPLGSWPLSSSYAVFYFCRKSLTSLEGDGVGTFHNGTLGTPMRLRLHRGFRLFRQHTQACADPFLLYVSYPLSLPVQSLNTVLLRLYLICSLPESKRVSSSGSTFAFYVICSLPERVGAGASLNRNLEAGVLPEASPGQDIAPVILLSQVLLRSGPRSNLGENKFARDRPGSSRRFQVLDLLRDDLARFRTLVAFHWMSRLIHGARGLK
ncbi:hypothetical protein DY000_02032114 [Brassica cretica]|uniref:Uncharacterized protein n=1 Tax=Brassica cretica TaxID=69181 RepID=A0ABQ7DP89_BRACR|nr:hypothetical protein DY000_02032114 [Brassica cretica]